MKIASDGFYFIVPGIIISALTAVLYFLTGYSLLIYQLISASIVTLFFTFFFRDPERISPQNSRAVLAAADGRIVEIDSRVPEYLIGYTNRISIFLSVFNVHINRIPISGRIIRLEYKPGKFRPAFLEKASEENEHTIIEIANNLGKLAFCQRAGTLARRIVCNLKVNQEVSSGVRFGMIRFGSRVDIYLPGNTVILVKKGDRVKAGETILGEFNSNES